MSEVNGDTIKNWPKDERPREKLFKSGEHTLSNTELIAILLRNGTHGQNAIDLSRKILSNLKCREPYLFLNIHGRRCTPDKVREHLKRASRQILGLEITPHYFRHRFLTECGKANVPIVDVMAISGIKDINVIVNYYSHSTDEGQAKVLEVTMV